jgi:hypothetical protein
MLAILHSVGMFVADLFKSRCRLEAENLFLRHQLSIALRRAPPRLRLRGRTCGEFLLRMQRITITRARTWRWARMRPWVGRSSGPVSLSLSQSWPGCTTNTSGYDFRKGHARQGKTHRKNRVSLCQARAPASGFQLMKVGNEIGWRAIDNNRARSRTLL